MVVLNESLQIINNLMEDNIVVRNRGGGCIVKHPPLFSADGKFLYILSGNCVSAFSVQTGDCVQQYISEDKDDIVCIATFGQLLLSVTHDGKLSIWDDPSKGSLKTIKLKLQDNNIVVGIYPVASQRDAQFNLVVMVKQPDAKYLELLLFSAKGKFLQNLYARPEEKPHTVSVCDKFVAVIKNDMVIVVPLNKNEQKNSLLAGSERCWTAVKCALGGRWLAAGDDTGRIVLWPDFRQPQTRSVFHWHTLPVTTIAFSPSGSYMYSGGGEGVMVRWSVEVSNVRNFLPRLPAPIVHLTVSPDNQYVAVATQDNGIQLVDSQNRVSSVIQRLAWGSRPQVGAPLLSAGLVWDPRSRSVVLNGRPGHLQFFNTDDNKLLYSLDIIGQNYLSRERHQEMMNAEVTQVAVSHDGKWLVTVETREDNTSVETLLKFWQYKFNARQFSLNTCIQRPHLGHVRRIKFQPTGSLPDQYLLVTTGTDSKFRVWVPSFSKSIHSEELSWLCDSVGSYRSLSPDCISFSADGSVLGVSFGASLTLWDTEISQLTTTLTRDANTLIAVEFGSVECCHLVVTASDSHLNVWSVLTLTVVWTVPLHITLLCSDPLSSTMAVFSADNSVYVFSPSNPKPLHEVKSLCKPGDSVVSALFVPRSAKLVDTTAPWCTDSQLHFIDTNQELRYLGLESEQDPERQDHERWRSNSTMVTPFSVVAAQQARSDVKLPTPTTHEQLNSNSEAHLRKLLNCPAHTMPHIHLFCASFLKSLAITRQTEEEKKQRDEINNVTKMEIDENSDSDENEKSSGTTKELNKKQKMAKIDELEKDSDPSDSESMVQITTNKPNEDLGTLNSQKMEENESIKKKLRRKSKQIKKSPKKKENSFSFDDLDSDWLTALENR